MDEKPILFFPFGHHYVGGGGAYPPAREIEEYAEILIRYGAKGTFFFDGIHVERLQAEGPDFFARFNSLGMSIGYHGEETHGPYPVIVDYLYPHAPSDASCIAGLPWDEAVRVVEERYTHAIEHGPIDPVTHLMDVYLGGRSDLSRTGGLALVQEAFGRDVDIYVGHSMEAASAGQAFARMTGCRVEQGSPPVTAHYLHIVGVPEMEAEAMALGGERSSLFWYMNHLVTKEEREMEMGGFFCDLETMKTRLSVADRSWPRLATLIMMPDPDGGRSDFEAQVRYLATEFIPANPGCRFVTAADLPALFRLQNPDSLSQRELSALANNLCDNWQGRPPDFLMVRDEGYSLVNAFEALAHAMAGYSRAGGLPAMVPLSEWLGPIGERGETPHAAEGSVALEDVLAACQAVVRQADSAKPPHLPLSVAIGGQRLNAAEFLLVMARAYCALAQGQPPERVEVTSAEVTPPYGDLMQTLFHPAEDNPLWHSKLQLWTVKPARLM